MVNVMLKPCQVQVKEGNVYILLKDRCFTVEINNKVYEFVPTREKEVVVSRRTGKIENKEAVLAFKKEDNIVYITMSELILMPEFLIEIHYIAKPYYEEEKTDPLIKETDAIINELEQMNVKRLIDKALDEGDKESFNQLIKFLK